MKTYFVKMLLFTFLINTLVLPHNENCQNNHYNVSLIRKNTQRAITKSRLLAQTQNHNPHYHNDPELKGIIDKLNDEAIKKYQQTHEPYEQLRELIEKKGTKLTGGNGAEPMSTIEKDLFETYEEMFGHKNDIMLKSGMYPNNNGKSDKSSFECTDTDNTELATTKGKDKYLKHLKHRCTRGICFCSVSSAFLTMLGLAFAKAAAVHFVLDTCNIKSICLSIFTITNIFNDAALKSALLANATSFSTCAGNAAGTAVGYATALKSAVGLSTTSLTACAGDAAGTAVGYATAIFTGCGIAALALLILAVVLIILYIWLYRRRKRSWKHECKKHL
ncbi:stevor, partial [Plasmodium reichenowi]